MLYEGWKFSSSRKKNRTTLDHPCSDFSKSGGEGCFQREVWFSLALESLTTKTWRRGGLTMFVRFFFRLEEGNLRKILFETLFLGGFEGGKLGRTATKKWRRGGLMLFDFFQIFGWTDERNLRKILIENLICCQVQKPRKTIFFSSFVVNIKLTPKKKDKINENLFGLADRQ